MNSRTAHRIDSQKKTTSIALVLFMGTGIYALACAPAILIAERLGWSQSFFHATQLATTLLCFLAAAFFLWLTRGSRLVCARWFAIVVCVLSRLWVAFTLYVLLSLDFSGIG